MTCPAIISAISAAVLRAVGISNLAASAPAPITGDCGSAQPIFRTQRSDGALLSRRDELAAKIKRARLNHKARSSLYSEAKGLTTDILARRG